MHTLIFSLIVIILTIQSSYCIDNSSTSGSNLDQVFSNMNKRLALSFSVAAFKLQKCKPIEDLVREKDILNTKTAQANLALDEIQTYFKGQMEANKMIQYEAMVLERTSLPSPAPTIESIRGQIDKLDKEVIPLLKPALDEMKSSANSAACLDRIDVLRKQNCPEKNEVFKLAMLRAATLFIESCLKVPCCTEK